MKNCFSLFLLIFLFCQTKAQNSSVNIVGKTNVNTFKCNQNTVQNLKLTLQQNRENYYNIPKISIPVKNFKCQNKLMTKDFLYTLNENQFPVISIDIRSIQKNNQHYHGIVAVQLMNKTKVYSVDFSYNDGRLSAKKQVSFSDFGIQPPKKMNGLITVKDELMIGFDFKLQ